MKETKQRKSKRHENNKNGISLIVLVITIIVMIVLAATVIISLSNNGIIDKANEAVNETDENQMKTLATTLWLDGYMENKRDEALVTFVETGLKKVDANYKSKYVVDITNTGVDLNSKEWEVIHDKSVTTEDGVAVIGEGLFIPNAIYRITLEGPEYSGTIETKAIFVEQQGTMYGCGLFGIYNNTAIGLESKEDFEQKISQYGNVAILGLGYSMYENNEFACAIELQNTTSTYTITKIEKLKNNKKFDENNIVYNTWYKGGYVGAYFLPNNRAYFKYEFVDTPTPIQVARWENDNGKIRVIFSNGGKFEIYPYVEVCIGNSSNDIAVLLTEQEKMTVTRNEDGYYVNAIYVAKQPSALGENVIDASISINEFVFDTIVRNDGSVEGGVTSSSTEFNKDDYIVSADGKSIIQKNGNVEYILVENIYDLVENSNN